MSPDLGAKKLLTLLSAVGLEIALSPAYRSTGHHQDYLKLACITANGSYTESLTPDELATALLSGKVPPERRPQMRAVFDEVPETVFNGMLMQVSTWSKPERVRHNAELLARQLGSRRSHRP